MTSFLTQTALTAARATGLFRLLRFRHRHELLVLTYHSVVEAAATARQQHPLVYRNAVTAEHFETQLRHLRRQYRLLDGDDLRAVLEGASLPAYPAVVTFDDALLNNATVALPLLRDLNVPAFFFLPTGFVDAASEDRQRLHWTEALVARLSAHSPGSAPFWGAVQTRLPNLDADLASLPESHASLRVVAHLKSCPRNIREERLEALDEILTALDPDAFPADTAGHSILQTMTWSHAREAAAHGVTLGSHTVNHTILNRQPDDAAATEIRKSRRRIQDETNQPADVFAYPNGRAQDFGPVHQDLLARAGYRGAFTQIPGFNDASTNPLRLRRIDVSADHDLSTFCYFASGCKRAVDRLRECTWTQE